MVMAWTLKSVADMPKEYTNKDDFKELRKENREDHKELREMINQLLNRGE
jgi:hypothetical protein